MTDGPIFRSAHSALLFAFTFSHTQHGTAAAAERRIAIQARERYEQDMVQGRGLRGIDGAAQAGMIRARVERSISPIHQAALIARFSILSDADRQAACAVLSLRARRFVPAPQDLRALTLLMRRHFGLRVNLPMLADDFDVALRTAQHWALSVRRWARPIEEQAMHRAEVELEAAGVVECANG